MAWINLEKTERKRNSERNEHTEMRDLRRQVYNTTTWRKLRELHLQRQPLCQKCLEEGKINGDNLQVHHIKSPFRNGKIDWELAYDPENLETICSVHHALEHKKYSDFQKNIDAQLKLLDELFNDDEG